MQSDSAVEESWLHQIWEHASDAMALSDASGVVLAANPAYYRLYGYEPQDVLGKSFALIFPAEQRDWAVTQYRETFEGDQPPPVVRSTVRSKDGIEHIVDARTSFLEQDGRRKAMLSVIRDVTQEVAAERAAVRAEHNLRAVLFSVSHDIKSPLAVIKGHAQLLRRYIARTSVAPPLDRLGDSLAQIEASSEDVGGLLDDLVELATVEDAARPPLHVTAMDLVDLVEQCVDRHQRLADEHEFVLELEAETLPGAWDQRRLARVIDNLLSNAIKYSPGGGLVTIKLRQDLASESSGEDTAARGGRAEGVVVEVIDNGIGIEAQDLRRVFERFHRGSNVPETAAGSGIGLTSVEQIVRQHGGTVDLSSQPGAGTTVRVWLPRQAQPPEATNS